MKKSILALIVATAAVLPLAAQDSPHFEVASIKRAGPPEARPAATTGFLPGGRFVAANITAERLLVLAFREEGTGTGLRPEQLVGVPSWMSSTMYSIEAKMAGPTTAERIVDPLAARLLRSLLEDRFKLTYHFEKRELPFYALVVDKPGSLGPNLKRSALDCEAIQKEREAARLAGRPANVPAPIPGRPMCAISLGGGRAVGMGTSMTILASALTGAAGNNTVLDRTGLTGGFDVEMRYSPEPASAGASAAIAPDPDAPSIFTAVREQLGLKLDQRREPRDVLVIDHVEPPAPD